MNKVLTKIFTCLTFLLILVACEPMTPEQQAAYNRQIEEQNRIRAQQCLNDNSCPETAAKVRAMCEPIIEREFDYEREDIYGNITKSAVNNISPSRYVDSQSSYGLGKNGYIPYYVSVVRDEIDGKYGNITDREVTSWSVKCVTVGDTPRILTVDYEFF
jgi:hypothetical protein